MPAMPVGILLLNTTRFCRMCFTVVDSRSFSCRRSKHRVTSIHAVRLRRLWPYVEHASSCVLCALGLARTGQS